MIIAAKKELRISGIKIKAGRFNYPQINYKEKATADQLKVLRDDMNMIKFSEILYMDEGGKVKKNASRTGKKAAKSGKKGSADSGSGDVSGKKKD